VVDSSYELTTCDSSYELVTCDSSYELTTCDSSYELTTCDSSYELTTCDSSYMWLIHKSIVQFMCVLLYTVFDSSHFLHLFSDLQCF
jgi:hypothetical protein